MADPLSITASIVGIVVPALHGTRLLLNDLEGLKDAPKTVKRLTDDVRSVDATLTLLKDVNEEDWKLLGINVAKRSETTVESCKQACDRFRTNLQRWTRHSDDGKLVWQDRAKVGFFKKDQIKAMSEQLQNCKLTITNVVSVATLYSSVRQNHITEEIRKTIAITHAEIEAAISTAGTQSVVLKSKLDELNLSSDEEEEDGEKEDKSEVLRQLEEGRKALEASRSLLEELLSKAQEDAVAKAIAGPSTHSVTFGNQNSGVQGYNIYGGVTIGRK